MKFLINIFKNNKSSLLIIYVYMLVAHSIFLCEPYIIGKTIDGLIHKDYMWVYVLISVEIFANFFIYRRMVFDTKVYSKIYNNLVIEYLESDKTSDKSSRNARTEMAQNIINFMENDVQYIIMSFVSIIGSLFFILFEHILTGFIVFFAFIPISFVVYLLYKKIAQGIRVSNSHYERKIDAINSEDEQSINQFLKRRRDLVIFNSTLQAKNWVSMNVIKGSFLIICLIVFTHSKTNLSQGQAIAMFSYINQFLISLMSIPIAVEISSRIKDIIKRIS
jgi:hypothetical protein